MDPDSWEDIFLLMLFISLNAFFSASEVALAGVRRARLKQLSEEGNLAARSVEHLTADSRRFLTTVQMGMALASFAAVAVAILSFPRRLEPFLAQVPRLAPASKSLASVLVLIASFLALLILGGLIPRMLALRYTEAVALFVARPLQLFATIFSPFITLLAGISGAVASFPGSSPLPSSSLIIEEEIKTIVDAGEEVGVIEEDEKEMIYGIFEIGETLVREIMVPRIDVAAIEVETPLLKALDVIIEAGHSRIPVYEETIDNIVGVLYAKDLLTYLRDGNRTAPLRTILRPPYFVPDSKRVDELLEDMQQRKVHMAIVVDEYGGTAGLVTIEDILEEIVGEIQDEYDTEEPFIEVISPDEVVLNARVSLDDVNKLLDVELPTWGGDTLGGLIYSQLGRVPAVGDEMVVDGLKLSVLSVSGRRIKKVRVCKMEKCGEEARQEQEVTGDREDGTSEANLNGA